MAAHLQNEGVLFQYRDGTQSSILLWDIVSIRTWHFVFYNEVIAIFKIKPK